jgi:hypothetical protein
MIAMLAAKVLDSFRRSSSKAIGRRAYAKIKAAKKGVKIFAMMLSYSRIHSF